ncbi:coiled-coil domain containing [Pseudohyphozyma bogoriensis]|nr:coiled-coil domain containing [Pseudohyphozyma bogoriensis]
MSTTMQDAAAARKEKLLALKRRREGHTDSAPGPTADRPEVFRFRNYDPETGTLRKHARTEEEDTVEKQVEGMADQVIKEDEARRAEELDLTNIQPKKPNWDLKRDLDRKLAKLKGKTDLAISQLIRKRIQAMKGGEAAASELVAAGAGPADEDADSDLDD